MTPDPVTVTPALAVLLLAERVAPWPVPPWLLVTAVALLAALAYAASCWWFPFAHCWCCQGGGKHLRDDGKVYRLCRWCTGTGRRLRIGRRVYNHYATLRADSARTRTGTRRNGRGGAR